MTQQLPLHQEFMLLALNDEGGNLEGSLPLYGVAGAMLSELLLQHRLTVDNDKQIVTVQDARPTGDELLDELLAQINEASQPKDLKYWVSKAATMKDLKNRVANHLCELGILKADESKLLFVFTRKVYPEVDRSYEDAIRDRMAAAMFGEETGDERTAVLISFAKNCALLRANFPKEEIKQHKQRIEELAEGKLLACGATQQAIQAVHTSIMVAVMTSSFVATMN
ncbi:MAG: GPP34 family phosphoprotein [Planctomycetota bacterium]